MPKILYALMIISVLPIVSAGVSSYFRAKQFGKADNKYPRIQQAQLTGAGARAVAAQGNAWEALMLVITSLFTAYVAGVDLNSLDTLAYVLVIARVLHLVFYLANKDVLRSTAFTVAWGCCLYLFYLAATVAK